jgi:hypothetical protein
MTTATLTLKTPAAAPAVPEVPAKTKPQRKSWFARVFDAMVEARMRHAQREIERYLLTTAPEDLRKRYAGKYGTYDDVGVRFMI